jgi:hypothetical protein
MGETRSRVPSKNLRIVLIAGAFFVFSRAFIARAEDTARPAAVRPSAEMTLELGVGTQGRLYYRPMFNYAWDLAPAGATQLFADLGYLQRTNDVYVGPIDYGLAFGLSQRLSEKFSAEASYSHFCRHLLSTENPYVLNLNEAAVKLRWRSGPWNLAVGYGRFVHGTPGFDDLAVFDVGIAPFLFSGLSFESRWKWVNFSYMYYDASLALRLTKGLSIFVRAAETYRMPSEMFLGLRLSTDASPARPVDHWTLTGEAFPRYDEHKLLVSGDYWVALARTPESRVFIDFAFDVPFLSGDGFFTVFYPDVMSYAVSAVAERKLGGLFGALYVRAAADMPADRAVPFTKNFGTGFLVRSQLDFDRLEHLFRFELGAGWNDSHGYDLKLRLGVNSVFSGGAPDIGAEVFWGQDRGLTTTDLRVFAAFGRDVSVRPFIGIRRVKDRTGPDVNGKLALGLTLHTRFE